jgi:hypothetical protein
MVADEGLESGESIPSSGEIDTGILAHVILDGLVNG